MPVVWNRNSGIENRLTTSLTRAQRGRVVSRSSTHGRISSATPAWKHTSATMHSVGGAMLENRSPGTPTIEPG